MKLKGVLITILPTYLDPEFYNRWKLLGKTYFDNEMCAHGDIEAVVTDHHTTIDDNFLMRFPNLKYVVSPNTGHTHLTFTDPDVKIISLKGETQFLKNIRSVSEFTMMQILKLHRESNDPRLLRGKTIGIVGLGRIGTQVYELAQAFGMKILFNDIVPKFGMPGFVSLPELFINSDVVSIHLPEGPKTKELINASLINLMKKSAFFINTSRASIVDTDDLFDAFDDGKISGIASDVNWDLRMLYKENRKVLLTPHIAGSSYEDRVATDRFVLQKMATELNLRLDKIP